MCQECGCLEIDKVTIDGKSPESMESLEKTYHHPHVHESSSSSPGSQVISIKEEILHKNNHIAAHNREHLAKQKIFCMNWVSAPGSGKTAILERMIHDLKKTLPIAVIEGDQQTDRDTQRILQTGTPALQINTGAACHLDAEMIHQALHQMNLETIRLLMIENVGNMVCPTAYDLGEYLKVAVISCPEGEDKPVKYPDLLLNARVLLINKIDLLPFLDFDLDQCVNLARKVNPMIAIFPVSARTGEGFEEFYDWLKSQQKSFLSSY